jgi:hypothetical protein
MSALVQRQLEYLKLNLPGTPETIQQMLAQAKRIRATIRRHADHCPTGPVDIETFITGEKYLNKQKAIYPLVMKELVAINSGDYVEAVLTGGIGSGKTTTALYTTAYQLYLLSCLRDPHEVYGMDSSSEILLIFQSINLRLAEAVTYTRFRDMIEKSPYFNRHFMFDKSLKSKMVFPNRIEVLPVSGLETATIGQNVMGGVIDELNYMSVIEKSKLSVDGAIYDQAISLYNSIAIRRKSRFLALGKLPGVLCLVSSRKYPGQFTDVKEEEAKTDPTIYVYDKCTWDIKPDVYSGETFTMFIGDETRKPRIVSKREKRDFEGDDEKLLREIPVEHQREFETDPIRALRDVAGLATLARHPFIMNTAAIGKCMDNKLRSVFAREWVDFARVKLKFLPKRFINLDEPRFAHVDLGLTGDSAGVCIGHIDEFVEMQHGGIIEVLPHIIIDGLVEVKPPKGSEIKFWKIRDVLYMLREEGLNIKWVTYDSYQSVDSLQLLHRQGFITGNQSLDNPRDGYDFLKTALYDGRVQVPTHAKLRRELASLEDEPKTGRVDHPPHGSKDCADSLAGVVYGLTRRRELWIRHGISLSRIPTSVQKALNRPDRMREIDEAA